MRFKLIQDIVLESHSGVCNKIKKEKKLRASW